MNGEQERVRFKYDTLNEFISGLQFKLGHVAGNCQQILDHLGRDHDAAFYPDAKLIERHAKSIQDAVLHISTALKGLSK